MRAVRHRRGWLVFLPISLIVVLAGAWTVLWFFEASLAETMMASWREREAREGRIHACGTQTISGYPFRLDLRCTDPTAELATAEAPLVLKAKEILVATKLFQPTLVTTKFIAPLTIAEPGRPPNFESSWTLAQTTVQGMPEAPERASVVLDDLVVNRVDGGNRASVLKAKRIDFQGRIAGGSAASNPLIDLALRLDAASAPELHPLAAQPLDADLSVQMRGLADFEPKPWPQRFREMQARRGGIDISKARVQQGELIAVGSGTLGLTARGDLEGEIQVTIVGLETFLQALDPDIILRMLDPNRTVSRQDIDSTLNTLDQFMPGFGQFARQNAASSVVAGLGAIGQNTTLEGKPAVTLPLRFADGAVFLGSIPIGSMSPLF